jgi:hypothetical protein
VSLIFPRFQLKLQYANKLNTKNHSVIVLMHATKWTRMTSQSAFSSCTVISGSDKTNCSVLRRCPLENVQNIFNVWLHAHREACANHGFAPFWIGSDGKTVRSLHRGKHKTSWPDMTDQTNQPSAGAGTHFTTSSREGVVGAVSRLQAGWSVVRIPALLFFPWEKRRGVRLATHRYLKAKLRMSGARSVVPYMHS